MSKASVAFDLPASPASSVAPVPRAPAKCKTSALSGVLVGIMGIVFGVGIMYLLSRVMQTNRKLAQLERQLKQQNGKLEEVVTQNLSLKAMSSAPMPMGPLGMPVGMGVPSANDMDMLMELLMHDIPLPASPSCSPSGCQRVEEVVEEKAPEEPQPVTSKEKQVASIVQETMKPLQTVVNEIEKQSEASDESSSSSSEEEETVAPPKRTRAPPKRRAQAK